MGSRPVRYLGYDMVRAMERLGPPNPDVLGVPDATMIRPTVMVVFDAVRGRDHARHADPPNCRRERERARMRPASRGSKR